MDGSQGTSNSPAPFLTKTYDMVEDSSTNPIVSWSSGNNSFVVWNPLEFARDLLPKYFKHNNFSSFVRQLNTYGFRKIDPDQWEFGNEEFIRGQRHLLKNIHRRKPIHSHSLHHHGQGSLTEAERQVFEDEIDKLKRDKSMLILDLQTHVAQRHEFEKQMQSLEARLHSMEVHQKQMMTFLAEIVQRPGFLSTLMQQSEIHGKKRRLPKPDYFYEDRVMEETRIVAFQPTTIEKPDTLSMLDVEPFEKMESSLDSLENLFRSVSQASGEESYDTVLASLPSAVVLTEMHASSGDKDINLQSQSPKLHPSSPSLGEIHSSEELAGTVNHVDSPVIPPIEHIETRSKISEIDVNSEPTVPEVSSSRDQPTKASASSVQIGVNDVFWQQFLTETPGLPGSSDTQEAESQRRNLDSRKSEAETTHRGSAFWWNMKNVDHLTEKLVHLTPAEKT